MEETWGIYACLMAKQSSMDAYGAGHTFGNNRALDRIDIRRQRRAVKVLAAMKTKRRHHTDKNLDG